jgi:hypothetical protein
MATGERTVRASALLAACCSGACHAHPTLTHAASRNPAVVIPKYLLSPQTAPYQRKTMCQSSTPAQYYREL